MNNFNPQAQDNISSCFYSDSSFNSEPETYPAAALALVQLFGK